MRFKTLNGSGYGLNGLTPSGGPVAAPMYLPLTPTDPLHAVNKDYVDSVLGHVPASSITGTIPVERLPAFTGNDISSTGYGIFTLKPTGVIPGVYNKITVNLKGMVVSGELIDYSVLSNVAWSTITADKPTTLEGYGVTDALKTIGGTVTGPLYTTSNASIDAHLVTKVYVDTSIDARVAQGGGQVGDIVQLASGVTPSKYLRANGAILSQAAYAALYAVIGDTYLPSGLSSDYIGQPWKQQYTFNTSTNLNVQNWTANASLPGGVAYSQAIVTKNYVYLIGGVTTSISTPSSIVYVAAINADGTLGSWGTAPSLPGTLSYSQAIITSTRVYLLGGLVGANASTIVYTAPINANGTLGSWVTGTPLPGSLGSSQAVVTKNRVYLLGGSSDGDAALSTVYTAPINADGTIGTWAAGTPLPVAIHDSQTVVTSNYVYLLAGDLGASESSAIYVAPINVDGTLGTWATNVTPFPVTMSESQVVVTRNQVYLFGGYFGSALSSNIYTAPINANGTLGSWTIAGVIPSALIDSQVIVTSSRVYLLGGSASGSSGVNTVYSAPFSGGFNDYFSLVTTSIVDTTTQFKLPDTTSTDPANTYSYIKAI